MARSKVSDARCHSGMPRQMSPDVPQHMRQRSAPGRCPPSQSFAISSTVFRRSWSCPRRGARRTCVCYRTSSRQVSRRHCRRQMWQACCRHHGRPPEGYRDSHSQMPGDPIASAAIFEAASDHRRATAAKGSIIAGSRLIGTWLRSAPSGDQAPIERVPRLAL